jgi:hypothetical protein
MHDCKFVVVRNYFLLLAVDRPFLSILVMCTSNMVHGCPTSMPSYEHDLFNIDTEHMSNNDDLLKFFVHGSYEVQHDPSSIYSFARIDERNRTNSSNNDERTPMGIDNDQKQENRLYSIFKGNYTTNIDVHEQSSIDSTLNRITCENSIESNMLSYARFAQCSSTMLVDMPTRPTKHNLTFEKNETKIFSNKHRSIEQGHEIKLRSLSSRIPCRTTAEQRTKVSSSPVVIQASRLPAKSTNNDKLFHYLDYLQTNDISTHHKRTNCQQATVNVIAISCLICCALFCFLSMYNSSRTNVKHRNPTMSSNNIQQYL